MKSTGIVRRIDDLGRVVIPKEIRKTIRVREGDPLEIFLDGEAIVFKKYSPISFCSFSAAKVLRNKVSQFAIYDRWGIIERKGNFDFPKVPKDEWNDSFSESFDYDKYVYPIVADGELYGYVVIPGKEKSDFVCGIVAMISANLSS